MSANQKQPTRTGLAKFSSRSAGFHATAKEHVNRLEPSKSSKSKSTSSEEEEEDGKYEEEEEEEEREHRKKKKKNLKKKNLKNCSKAYDARNKRVEYAIKIPQKFLSHEFKKVSNFRVLIVALFFVLIVALAIEEYLPQENEMKRTLQEKRKKANERVRAHARKARRAIDAYTKYDYERANDWKYEENLRKEYALAALVADGGASELNGVVSNLNSNNNDNSNNNKAYFGAAATIDNGDDERTEVDDVEVEAAGVGEEAFNDDSNSLINKDKFLRTRLMRAEQALMREQKTFEIPDAPSPPPPPPAKPSPPPLSHHLSQDCLKRQYLKDAQIQFFSKNYCKFDSSTVQTVNPFERQVKGQPTQLRTLPEVLLATYFQSVSYSDIGILARKEAYGKEALQRPGLLEPTEKLVARELQDPINVDSSVEDISSVQSGVNAADEYASSFDDNNSGGNRRMLLSKKHQEELANKKAFKDREKKRKEENVKKINTSPPPPPQPPFIEFEYRGKKSPKWMDGTTGQSKYAPYFSATFLGASLGPFAHVARTLMNAAHLNGVVRVWEGNSVLFKTLERNWVQKDQAMKISKEGNVVAALVNAHVWGQKAGSVESADDLFVKRRSSFGKHTIEPAVSLKYALTVSNLFHGEGCEIPTVLAFDGDEFFSDLRPKLREAMNSAKIKAVSFTATSFDKAAAFSREYPEFLVYVVGAGNGGILNDENIVVDNDDFGASQAVFSSAKPSILLIDDFTYSPVFEEIFKQTKQKTRTLAMLAVRKNDPFHEMIKNNAFLSCSCDGSCKSDVVGVVNGGFCEPVEVAKKKKTLVQKILANSASAMNPETFGTVDNGVNGIIQDWTR